MLDGYEIHAGRNTFGPGCVPWLRIGGQTDGVCSREGTVVGTYLHGLFDDGLFFSALAAHVRAQRGEDAGAKGPVLTMNDFREREFDRIADIVRAAVDMPAVYRIIRGEE